MKVTHTLPESKIIIDIEYLERPCPRKKKNYKI